MKLLKVLGTGLCLTLLCIVVAPKAKASEENHKTSITFSGPIEVPGVGQHLLPPGTYVFQLLESLTNRHIVQISNADESQVLTTILAIPNYRLKATGKTVVTFHEAVAGQPEAIRAWFYPGAQWGEHFVYEKPRAIQLAQETNEAELATPVASTSVDDLKAAPVEAVSPAGDTVDTATVVEAPPATTEAAVAEPAAPAPVMMASLPKTASNLPLIGLVGLLTLAGGFVLTGFLKFMA